MIPRSEDYNYNATKGRYRNQFSKASEPECYNANPMISLENVALELPFGSISKYMSENISLVVLVSLARADFRQLIDRELG